MFSAYPEGWPGLGLLLLRAAAGGVLVVQGIMFYQAEQSLRPLILLMIVVTVSVGTFLCIGLLTRFAAAVAVTGTVGSMIDLLPAPRLGLFEARSTAILTLVIVAAVASVGPGAFSVDARLFGRREVIIPKSPDDTGI